MKRLMELFEGSQLSRHTINKKSVDICRALKTSLLHDLTVCMECNKGLVSQHIASIHIYRSQEVMGLWFSDLFIILSSSICLLQEAQHHFRTMLSVA